MSIAVEPIAIGIVDVIQAAIDTAVALTANQVTNGRPQSQTLPEIDWAHIAGILNAAYPGYAQPKKYDANTVATLMAEMIARIAGETQGAYFGEVTLGNAVGVLQGQVGALQSSVKSLTGTEASRSSVTALANTVAALQRDLAVDYQNAINRANNLYNLENQRLGAVYNELIATISTEYLTAIHYSQQLYNQAIAAVNAAEATAVAHANNLYNLTNVNIGNVYNLLHENLGAEQNARIAGDQTVLHEAVTNATAQSAAALSAATAFTLSHVGALQTLVESQLSKVNTELETCLDPMCDTVAPNSKSLGKLGNLLTGLVDASLLGALLAFLAECAADPHAAAVEAEAIAGPVAHATAVGMRDLLGV